MKTPLITIVAAFLLAACVQTASVRVDPSLSPDDQKRDIALQRERGDITYAQAARAQYDVERTTVQLTPGQNAFWQESIDLAVAVDEGRLPRDQYRARVQEAYNRLVGV